MKERHNEKIKGGILIFRRGDTTGRIKTTSILKGVVPFEHGNLFEAIEEAKRLSLIHPDKEFSVFAETMTIKNGKRVMEIEQ